MHVLQLYMNKFAQEHLCVMSHVHVSCFTLEHEILNTVICVYVCFTEV